jgi:hypothetical protein
MEFLHPTDFPLTVLTDASHFSGDGVIGAGVVVVVVVIEIGVVVVVKIGFVLVRAVVVALTSFDDGAIS